MREIMGQNKEPDYYISRRSGDIYLYHVASHIAGVNYEITTKIPPGSKITIKAGQMIRVLIASALSALEIP